MDREDVTIEKVAEQFLIEVTDIENRDGLFLLMKYTLYHCKGL